MIVLAHSGHWLIGVLQFTPVIAFLGWLVYTRIHDRGRVDEEQSTPSP